MEHICKSCGKRKGDATDWLLGFESVSAGRIMKGTITLLGKWDEQRADEPHAVHFCSPTCQTKYLVENYGDGTWVT
jgi:hypothetical protein